MPDEASLSVVIGATGATGRLVVRNLVESGERVRAVNRSGRGAVPPGVELVGVDDAAASHLVEVCRGASVVYHCAMPPFTRWRDQFPRLTDNILRAAGSAGARLVYADDTWMYGRTETPMTETTAPRPASNSGVLRAWLAERILHAHARGDVRATIARASELYGPGVTSLLGSNIFVPAVKGRVAVWLGDPNQPITPTYIDDFARAVVTLGSSAESEGRVWHVPTPHATTGRQFVREVFTQAGHRTRLVSIGTRTARVLGAVSPLVRQGAEIVYQFEQPFVVDGSRFTAQFGDLPVTPYRRAIGDTVRWYRRDQPVPAAVRERDSVDA
jgi:nucleoside-diphosphate-sugar epimerase